MFPDWQGTIKALWRSRHDVTRVITGAPPRADYTNPSRDRYPSSRLPILPTHLPLPLPPSLAWPNPWIGPRALQGSGDPLLH